MYGIDKHIQYNHRVDAANFSSASKFWTFQVTANGTEKKTIRSRFYLVCTGYYDYEQALQTTIPGIEDFKGTVAHPQFWPDEMDYENKNIVIVGSGATAITLLPNLAKKASNVTILQRSPSYIMAMPKEDALERGIRSLFSWSPSIQRQLIRWKWLVVPVSRRSSSLACRS